MENGLPVVLYGVDSVYSAEVAETLYRMNLEIAAGVLTGPPEWDLRGIAPVIEERDIDSRLNKFPFAVPWVTPRFKADRWQRARAAGFTNFLTLVHPTAVVASTAALGAGCFTNIYATVGAYCVLGSGVMICSKAHVGHHTVLEEFVSVGPGATLGGRCHVARGALIGMGATLGPGLKVGSNSVVALGAAVVSDVSDNVMVAGCPAKVVKTL